MFLYKSATNKEKATAPTLVTKHGSHNQASHGRRGGGGGGGGGGSSKPSNISAKGDKEKIKNMSGAIDRAKIDIGAGFADARNSGYQIKELQNLRDGTKSLDRAQANLKRLTGAKTPEQKSKIADKVVTDLDNAIESVDSGYASREIEVAVADLYDIREMALGFIEENDR